VQRSVAAQRWMLKQQQGIRGCVSHYLTALISAIFAAEARVEAAIPREELLAGVEAAFAEQNQKRWNWVLC
jgi:hypothetical protein